ncbi:MULTISPECIES: ABC transporter ATP-binding protein [Bradyrhizobium]|jgi:peptide/nickel transport system ATP-binding protein|uniref:ABC transporter ATP-binding protein n=1 Tax=Bradyrhizobium TaxID=374 RepID=UPI0004851D05|nr:MULTISPECIES: ABC transporter ATP-binding protein [Bradyrhizobium]MCS3451255.1 peptide/nickel transport system ATP-binding protein [Bradyrhizobium elkanii]MCS3566721.1 peptide/nickel transport system ATP-binding protein [Bradyrhizobium elkanii]MCW2152553.1 peptide/nickel transport system ATP-binding protein [Bradyrhizobium elkanii]MCW2357569.1 peptide/nickel transport system ATP-binding protein [Bradyrhizobium elkanii]MCW2376285.1 peptide/nickel transport system ATP-binding protein [Bradyrh
MPALLDISGLTISFPNATPVRDLSFSVAPAETLAIVGESGSGKSLTALALMRLLPSTAQIATGRIRLGDDDLTALPEIEMRRRRGRDIAMIFQEPMTSLNPVLTIGRQIAEVLQVHRGLSKAQARREAAELLDLVRIPNPERCLDDYPHRLSGGMRQRVMIAIAAACRPKVLIADEPTTALDVTIQAQMLELLDRLRRELSLSLLLITHDLGLVGQWADRVVVMYAGRKVEEAPPDELFGRPLHPYTHGLLAASPRLHDDLHYRNARLSEIPGSIASAAAEPGCPFAPRCPARQSLCRDHFPVERSAAPRRRLACHVESANLSHGLPHDASVGL